MVNIGKNRSNNQKNVLNNLSKRRLTNLVPSLFDYTTDIFDIGQRNCHVKILRNVFVFYNKLCTLKDRSHEKCLAFGHVNYYGNNNTSVIII